MFRNFSSRITELPTFLVPRRSMSNWMFHVPHILGCSPTSRLLYHFLSTRSFCSCISLNFSKAGHWTASVNLFYSLNTLIWFVSYQVYNTVLGFRRVHKTRNPDRTAELGGPKDLPHCWHQLQVWRFWTPRSLSVIRNLKELSEGCYTCGSSLL